MLGIGTRTRIADSSQVNEISNGASGQPRVSFRPTLQRLWPKVAVPALSILPCVGGHQMLPTALSSSSSARTCTEKEDVGFKPGPVPGCEVLGTEGGALLSTINDK